MEASPEGFLCLCALFEGTYFHPYLLSLLQDNCPVAAPSLSISCCSAWPGPAGCAGGEPGLAARYKQSLHPQLWQCAPGVGAEDTQEEATVLTIAGLELA